MTQSNETQTIEQQVKVEILRLASRRVECKPCAGTGQSQPGRVSADCPDCQGPGTILDPKFEGLRGFCPYCANDKEAGPCEDCDDRHFLSVSIPDAARFGRESEEFKAYIEAGTLTRQDVFKLLWSDNEVVMAMGQCWPEGE